MAMDLSGAAEVVRAFLAAAVDRGDAEAAKALLSKETLEGGSFHVSEQMRGARYVVGEAREEGGEVWVEVVMTDAGSGMSQTLPFAPVREEGAWKLDMGRMMMRMMGGAMEAVVEKVGEAMGSVVGAVGKALGAALGGGESGEAGGMEAVGNGGRAPIVPPHALEEFEKRIGEMESAVRARHGVSIPIEVDVATVLRGEDSPAENARMLERVTGEVLGNWEYAVSEAARQLRHMGRVKGLRLEGVREAGERALFAEGKRVVYRLCVQKEEGYYNSERLGELLVGVAAGIAEGDGGEKTAAIPEGDADELAAAYREGVMPVLERRLGDLIGHEAPFEMMWSSLNSADAAGLWVWGLNRVVGAVGLLVARSEGSSEALGEGLERVVVTVVEDPGAKSVRMSGRELLVYCCPSAGEAGSFYEVELAEAISAGLHLRTRPMVAELEGYAKQWEASLLEIFGRPIKYAFDWDGFTCQPDEARNVFALTLLREHGIDALYYALRKLAEGNPNFRQQFPSRVQWLYLEHVPASERKAVSGEQTTIRYQLYLHEGYRGYLTQAELEAALPGIVAGMPDIDFGEAVVEETVVAVEAGGEAGVEGGAAEGGGYFAELEEKLSRYSGYVQELFGNGMHVIVDGDRLENEQVPGFVSGAMSSLDRTLEAAAKDPWLHAAIAAMVDRVEVGLAREGEAEGFSLAERVVRYAVKSVTGVPEMGDEGRLAWLGAALGVEEAKAAAYGGVPGERVRVKPATKKAGGKGGSGKKAAGQGKARSGDAKKAGKKPSARKRK